MFFLPQIRESCELKSMTVKFLGQYHSLGKHQNEHPSDETWEFQGRAKTMESYAISTSLTRTPGPPSWGRL